MLSTFELQNLEEETIGAEVGEKGEEEVQKLELEGIRVVEVGVVQKSELKEEEGVEKGIRVEVGDLQKSESKEKQEVDDVGIESSQIGWLPSDV